MSEDIIVIENVNQVIEISDDSLLEAKAEDILIINNDINLQLNEGKEQLNNFNTDLKNTSSTTKETKFKKNLGMTRKTRNRRKRNRLKNMEKTKACRNRICKNVNISIGNNRNSGESVNEIQNTGVTNELNFCNIMEQSESINSTVNEPSNCNSSRPIPIGSPEQHLSNYDFLKLKWLKPLSNLLSPPHLQIVIIDRSHQDWRIANDKWLLVEKRLLEALNNEMLRTKDTSIGLFDGAKWQKGIKIVGCHNENAFNFITKFIINLEKLWDGAKLDVFPITHVARHVVKGFIPPPTLETELIMSLIKLQNPSICCEDWIVIKKRERQYNEGIDIWLSINDESFTHLCRLRGEIKYGINRIWLNPSN